MSTEIQYLLIILAAVMLIGLVAKLVKGIAKAIALGVIVLIALISLGLVTTDQLKEAAEVGKGVIEGEYRDEDSLSNAIDDLFD